MRLTAKQRRKKNQQNARRSCGPTSVAGKEVSRTNSIQHGLTATVLTLPDENPDHVKTETNAWRDNFQPQGHAEEVLVGQLALATVRLERLARAEEAVIDEQARNAEFVWDYMKKHRLVEATNILYVDPARAAIELRAFGAGVAWLLARLGELAATFDIDDCWPDVVSIQQAFRYLGHDPLMLHQESVAAWKFAEMTIQCVKDPKRAEGLAMALGFELPENWRDRCRIEDAARAVRQRINDEIASLKVLAEAFGALEAASRAEAKTRAIVPIDTPQTRLMLRYRQAAQTSFDRSLKALQKLQSDRQKAAELEAEEAEKVDLPNEANLVGRTRSKRIQVGSCVTINGLKFEVVETSDGNVLMCPWVESAEAPVLGVVPAPETGV